MRQLEFGSFSPSFVGVDLRFGTARMYQHFSELWLRPGTRGRLPNANKASRFTHISAATTFEHELKHFHDFLWCNNSLSIFWLRIQALLNSMSVIKEFGEDKSFEAIPVPVTDWLGMDASARLRFQKHAAAWPELKNLSFWEPPVIDRSAHRIGGGSKPFRPGEEALAELYRLLASQYGQIKQLREGYHPPVEGFSRITPRFAYEISALAAQFGAVYLIYGEEECAEFLNGLARETNPVMQTFMTVLRVFSPKGQTDSKQLYVDRIDWRGVQAVGFWCLSGNYHLDGQGSCPAVRLSAIMEAISADRFRFLPPQMSRFELAEHWSRLLEVSSPFESMTTTRQMLSVNSERLMEKFGGEIKNSETASMAMEVVDNVLDANSDILKEFQSDPDNYIEPGKYNTKLERWPGGPTLIDIRGTSCEFVGDEPLKTTPCGPGSEKQVMIMASFSNPKTHFDPEKNMSLRQNFLAMDVIFDHHQVAPVDEVAAVNVFEKEYGKTLLFLN